MPYGGKPPPSGHDPGTPFDTPPPAPPPRYGGEDWYREGERDPEEGGFSTREDKRSQRLEQRYKRPGFQRRLQRT